uniref:Uncharacterized protein n=1 Tax=Parascaris equorum TaxID=6256 RepID=A0A914R6R7_PAREQ
MRIHKICEISESYCIIFSCFALLSLSLSLKRNFFKTSFL